MSKAFTKDSDGTDDEDPPEAEAPPVKNYMTPRGFAALQDELRQLQVIERPKVVETVTWAAGNGDRSENGDYIYGKKRLREIDRRARYLIKRLETAIVIDPRDQAKLKQVFFGATVTVARADDTEQTIQLVGTDEADAVTGKISWIAPIAKCLMKASVGDIVDLRTPGGIEKLEIVDIRYV